MERIRRPGRPGEKKESFSFWFLSIQRRKKKIWLLGRRTAALKDGMEVGSLGRGGRTIKLRKKKKPSWSLTPYVA